MTEHHDDDAILLVAMRVDKDDIGGSLNKALHLFAEGVGKGVVAQAMEPPLRARHYDQLRAAGFDPRNIERDLGLAVVSHD